MAKKEELVVIENYASGHASAIQLKKGHEHDDTSLLGDIMREISARASSTSETNFHQNETSANTHKQHADEYHPQSNYTSKNQRFSSSVSMETTMQDSLNNAYGGDGGAIPPPPRPCTSQPPNRQQSLSISVSEGIVDTKTETTQSVHGESEHLLMSQKYGIVTEDTINSTPKPNKSKVQCDPQTKLLKEHAVLGSNSVMSCASTDNFHPCSIADLEQQGKEKLNINTTKGVTLPHRSMSLLVSSTNKPRFARIADVSHRLSPGFPALTQSTQNIFKSSNDITDKLNVPTSQRRNSLEHIGDDRCHPKACQDAKTINYSHKKSLQRGWSISNIDLQGKSHSASELLQDIPYTPTSDTEDTKDKWSRKKSGSLRRMLSGLGMMIHRRKEHPSMVESNDKGKIFQPLSCIM